MDELFRKPCTAFAGSRHLAAGSLREVALAVKACLEGDPREPVSIFSDETGAVIDLDLRGTDEEILARLAPPRGRLGDASQAGGGGPAGAVRLRPGGLRGQYPKLARGRAGIHPEAGGARLRWGGVMSEPLDRKAALRAYRERKVRSGIHAVRHGATGRAWAGSSPDLDAAKNGLWNRLEEGRHLDRELQSEWKRLGADAFEYVILEVIEEEMEPWALKETLKTRKAEWTKRLSERSPV